MKKVLLGGLLGLFIGGAVMLFFSWGEGIISFRLVPPRIESLEFTPQVALMLFQGSPDRRNCRGRWGLGAVAGIVVGYGLGFFFL